LLWWGKEGRERGAVIFVLGETLMPSWRRHLWLPFRGLGRGQALEDNSKAKTSMAQFPAQLCDLGKVPLPF
jgi:hypothetical protein